VGVIQISTDVPAEERRDHGDAALTGQREKGRGDPAVVYMERYYVLSLYRRSPQGVESRNEHPPAGWRVDVIVEKGESVNSREWEPLRFQRLNREDHRSFWSECQQLIVDIAHVDAEVGDQALGDCLHATVG